MRYAGACGGAARDKHRKSNKLAEKIPPPKIVEPGNMVSHNKKRLTTEGQSVGLEYQSVYGSVNTVSYIVPAICRTQAVVLAQQVALSLVSFAITSHSVFVPSFAQTWSA